MFSGPHSAHSHSRHISNFTEFPDEGVFSAFVVISLRFFTFVEFKFLHFEKFLLERYKNFDFSACVTGFVVSFQIPDDSLYQDSFLSS